MQNIIELKHVYKDYPQGGAMQTVLHDINLRVAAGEFVAIVGPSGNGKSTLLNLLTGIDHPSRGEVQINGTALQQLSNEKLCAWRGVQVGIVFQFFQLLPALSLLQNIVLPMEFLGRLSKRQRQERAMLLLEQVGLADAAQRLPARFPAASTTRGDCAGFG